MCQLQRDVIYCDETPVQVLKEERKKPQTKSYMWLYRTGIAGKAPIVLYDYRPSRNGDHAVNFLKDFKGYVHSDGYAGYNKLTGITRCGCWLSKLNVLKGSALGKATAYVQNQKPYMENYLLDGRCSISNNAAENAIRLTIK